MIPKMTASTGVMTVQNAGSPMIPSTNDATQNPLLVPAASSVVPSIVNGIPQLLQLLAVTGLTDAQRGHWMVCDPSVRRTIFGARSPAAAYAWTGCGSCLMIWRGLGTISRP